MGEPEPGQVHQLNRCVLSDREAQVVRLLLTGYGVPTIARMLFIGQSTVRNHLSAVFRKLRVNWQEELTLLFFALWRDGRTPAHPARGQAAAPALPQACNTWVWQEPEATA